MVNENAHIRFVLKLLLLFSIHTAQISEPVHEISNNVVCATSKSSDQPAHMRSLTEPLLVARIFCDFKATD